MENRSFLEEIDDDYTKAPKSRPSKSLAIPTIQEVIENIKVKPEEVSFFEFIMMSTRYAVVLGELNKAKEKLGEPKYELGDCSLLYNKSLIELGVKSNYGRVKENLHNRQKKEDDTQSKSSLTWSDIVRKTPTTFKKPKSTAFSESEIQTKVIDAEFKEEIQEIIRRKKEKTKILRDNRVKKEEKAIVTENRFTALEEKETPIVLTTHQTRDEVVKEETREDKLTKIKMLKKFRATRRRRRVQLAEEAENYFLDCQISKNEESVGLPKTVQPTSLPRHEVNYHSKEIFRRSSIYAEMVDIFLVTILMNKSIMTDSVFIQLAKQKGITDLGDVSLLYKLFLESSSK